VLKASSITIPLSQTAQSYVHDYSRHWNRARFSSQPFFPYCVSRYVQIIHAQIVFIPLRHSSSSKLLASPYSILRGTETELYILNTSIFSVYKVTSEPANHSHCDFQSGCPCLSSHTLTPVAVFNSWGVSGTTRPTVL
jgi:hypothetical protein